MSRRKTPAELEEEMNASMAADQARAQIMLDCFHLDCYPSQWSWEKGQPKEMTCNDCGAINYLEE